MSQFKTLFTQVPFCKRGWKTPAIILVVFYIGTIAWGTHLLTDHMNVDFEDVFNPEHIIEVVAESFQGTKTVAFNQATSPSYVQLSLVNIAIDNERISKAEKKKIEPVQRVKNMGSGVIIHPDGYVVTAYHLVQSLRGIKIITKTPDGQRVYAAKILKVLPNHNLALLKIVSHDVFPYLQLDFAKSLKKGDPVTAWGSAQQGIDVISHHGAIISMPSENAIKVKDFRLTHLIATDAVFHGTQNGGPLVNEQGRLVGINVAIVSDQKIQGYAVPSYVLYSHFQDVVDFRPSLPKMANKPENGNQNQAQNQKIINSAPANAIKDNTNTITKATNTTDGQAANKNLSDKWWDIAKSTLPAHKRQQTNQLSAADNQPINKTHQAEKRLWGFSIGHVLGLLVLGFFAGICGGMMTMGGGIITVYGLMSIFGYSLFIVRPVAFITNIFTYGAAVLRYREEGILNWKTIKPLIPMAMLGVVIGYFVGIMMSKSAIQILLGTFAMLIGLKMLIELFEAEIDRAKSGFLAWLKLFTTSGVPNKPKQSPHPLVVNGLLGLPMGLISGILGITGGVLEVPLQRYLAGNNLRTAIANSATLVFFASITGALVSMIYGVQVGAFDLLVPITMAVILIPGAYIGGRIGARLTTVLPLDVLRWFYAILMFIIAVRMFWIL